MGSRFVGPLLIFAYALLSKPFLGEYAGNIGAEIGGNFTSFYAVKVCTKAY